MNPVILIPARLASTRLPNKPLADIAGDPMIVHVWRRAVASKIGEVFVACDDERIFAAIQKAGGKAVMTRADHMSGSDRIYEALQKIDPHNKYDVVVNVQGDVPTIEPDVIRAVLEPLESPSVDIATLACEIKDEKEIGDPAVVKVIFSGGTLPPVSLRETPPTRSSYSTPPRTYTAVNFLRSTTSSGETLYHHIGIYAYRRSALERFVNLPPSPRELQEKLEQLRALEAGIKIGVAIVDTVPLGVDTQEHLDKARKIIANNSQL